jgi:hypothetical protein
MPKLMSYTADGWQHAWDGTSVAAYEKCPRYYKLRYLDGWQPRHRSEHLTFGGVFASALELHCKLVAEGSDNPLRAVIRQAMIDTWVIEYDEDGNEDGGTPWLSLHPTKTRETLIRSIVWYVENFIDDPTETVVLSNGKAAAELSFSIPLSADILYCGHLDRLVSYSGGKYVMDQKTTGTTTTPRFFDGFKPDVQMGGYTWAGKQLFDLPLSGVIIDAVQIAVGFTKFVRGFVTYPEPLLVEWHDNTISTIAEAKRSHEANVYPMRRSSCGNYGGCEFRRVCSRIPAHRETILHAEFERAERWDPLQRR